MLKSFRAKLAAIVGVAAFAFSVVIGMSWVINRGVTEQLVSIQERFVPQLELGPQVEGQFEQLRRSLQDAVAARDGDALEGTREQYAGLLRRLAAAHDLLPGAETDQLNHAIQEWYESAYDLSRRMIEGETGEGLVNAMSAMQAKQVASAALLKRVTSFDRREFAHIFEAASQALLNGGRLRLFVGVACLGFVILLSLWLSRNALRSLAELGAGLERFGQGAFDQLIPVAGNDELAGVARRANLMAQNLQRLHAEREHGDWLKNALVGLAQEVRGELSPGEVGARAARFIARYLGAPVAVLYYTDSARVLRLIGEYGLAPMDPELASSLAFRAGEGLVGQACLQDEITVISDPPANYLRIRSGTGEGSPRALAFLPIPHLGAVAGVLELGLFRPWQAHFGELLLSMRETLAIAIEVARTRTVLSEMLSESQRQAERLSAQEEELQSNNEQLQVQQEELRQTNEELTQQTEELEAQRRELQEKNQELDKVGTHLRQQAEELKQVSAYKSQFLANMSHELRTPLNSMLLLSNLLAENETKSLSAKQVEFARTIHGAGKDLLALINQVLDLAKMEAGKQQLRIERLDLAQMIGHTERVFRPLAADKKLELRTRLWPGLPEAIFTDPQRLQQILNNLLGNAIKFTQHGHVSLDIRPPGAGERFRRAGLQDNAVVFAVSDSGMGIAAEHQERIFSPFEQVEAASDRRFGGTGLGLTIARELADLMGGTLDLTSAPGRGSTFSCVLPYQAPAQDAPQTVARAAAAARAPLAPALTDAPPPSNAEAYLLVVEDDPLFAESVGDAIRSHGLAWERAADGKTALELCRRKPPSGIILDLKLPDLDGWQIMEQLRAEPSTASIPVHFISAADAAERALALGAVGYLTKPASRQELTRAILALVPQPSDPSRCILLIEQDTLRAAALVRELAGENLQVKSVADASAALLALERERFACVILDPPDQVEGRKFAQALRERLGAEAPSLIVYTALPLGKEEVKQLDAYAEAIVLQEGSSSERLLDEVRLFVRRLKGGIAPRRSGVARALPPHVRLEGKRILVVDDDMRTVYALSATLRAKGAEVLVAENGKAALEVLTRNPRLDAVLMDIMMPELDGYETMRRIRNDLQLTNLVIVSLTAKAMKGDRERCLQMGASDYLAKPIDPERLLALLHGLLSASAPGSGEREAAARANGEQGKRADGR